MRGRMPREIIVPDFSITIEITGNGIKSDTTYARVKYNGSTYTSAQTLTLQPGEKLSCGAYHAFTSGSASVTLNGTVVAKLTGEIGWTSYTYYPATDATINLSAGNYGGSITITEGSA